MIRATGPRPMPSAFEATALRANGSRLLVVDGDSEVRSRLCDYLGSNDFHVTAVGTGKHALEILEREAIDLLLLEPMLRGEDGLQLTQAVRDSSTLPIVVVSQRCEEADRVMGLELGADDYVAKPFSSRELLARIRAVLRRTRAGAPRAGPDESLRAYRFEGWDMNLRVLSLHAPDGRKVDLTRREFGLLRAFLSAPQRIVTRGQLLDLIHVHGADVYDRSIDVLVARLRRKIEADVSRPRFIRTERSVGYFFDAAVTVVR